MWITRHIPWVLLTSAIFHRKFCYIKKYMCRLYFESKFLIILAFLESLRIALIKKVTVLLMSAKTATSGLLKITVFWNKVYDVIIYVRDITSKFLSRDSNYIVHTAMWPRFGDSNISIRKLFYRDLTRKTAFFESRSWFKFNNLGLALGMNWNFYTSVAKGLKLKVRKFFGLVPMFVEVTGEKTVGGLLAPFHPE